MANAFPSRLVDSVNGLIGKVKLLILKTVTFNPTTPSLLEFKDQDGGLLDNINIGVSNVENLQTSLNGKVDDSQVLTNVPAGAVFTDTVPIQNTDNPYLTEAAMHADQVNQLQGYGYLVDGVGAFTYLGTVAGTAADYEGFGGGTGLDLRASNLAGDLSTAEQDAIRLKIGTAISPAPFLDEVIPDSYLPSTTGMFKLKGSFFTENMTVTTTGGTVNYITFNNDNDVDVNITTGATEGSFSVTINNGISKTFNGALLIVLGTVFKPIPTDFISISEPINIDNEGSVLVEQWSVIGTAILDPLKFKLDTLNFRFYFNYSLSPLGSNFNNTKYMSLQFFRVSDDVEVYRFRQMKNNETFNYLYISEIADLSNLSNFFATHSLSNEVYLQRKDGVMYLYINNAIDTTFNYCETEDLYLKFTVSRFDFTKIKKVELA